MLALCYQTIQLSQKYLGILGGISLLILNAITDCVLEYEIKVEDDFFVCIQNNLKVFINGEYVAPCSQGYLNSHAETLLRIALEKMIGNLVDSVWRVLCSELISILLQEGMITV